MEIVLGLLTLYLSINAANSAPHKFYGDLDTYGGYDNGYGSFTSLGSYRRGYSSLSSYNPYNAYDSYGDSFSSLIGNRCVCPKGKKTCLKCTPKAKGVNKKRIKSRIQSSTNDEPDWIKTFPDIDALKEKLLSEDKRTSSPSPPESSSEETEEEEAKEEKRTEQPNQQNVDKNNDDDDDDEEEEIES